MFVVYDLDGTLIIDHDEFGFYIYRTSYAKDIPNQPIVDTARLMIEAGHDVHVWTGRSDRHWVETEAWLRMVLGDSNFDKITLRMKPDGDRRSSNDVKGDWLADYPSLPDIIFDDRAKCVAFWRSLGIVTCQVADHI